MTQDIREKINLTFFREKKFIILNLKNIFIETEHLIKFFHSVTKFIIESNVDYVLHDSLSKISIRRHSNVDVIQIYIGIAKDFVRNRIYNLFKYRMTTNFSCYLRISDKKEKFTKKIISQYLLMNSLNQAIKKKNIWFTLSMITKLQKNDAIMKTANKHRILKQKNWKLWIRTCERYWIDKIKWKYEIVTRTWDLKKIIFFTIHDFDEILEIADFRRLIMFLNFHEILEKKSETSKTTSIFWDEHLLRSSKNLWIDFKKILNQKTKRRHENAFFSKKKY